MLMPDRITVDIEGFRDILESLAKTGERSLAQQVRLFIREGIERNQPATDNTPAGDFIRLLASKTPPQNGELVRLAHAIGVDVELLKEISDCVVRGKNGDKTPVNR